MRQKFQPIDIDLECAEVLNSEGLNLATELILKHILYQRQQIPLQVESLQREASKSRPTAEICPKEESDFSKLPISSININNSLLSKKEANMRVQNSVSEQLEY